MGRLGTYTRLTLNIKCTPYYKHVVECILLFSTNLMKKAPTYAFTYIHQYWRWMENLNESPHTLRLFNIFNITRIIGC